MKNTEEHRRVLSTLLWRVLEQVGPKLPDQDRELIADFVDANEFGVAVEWLEAVAARRQLIIPPVALKDLAEAKQKLGM